MSDFKLLACLLACFEQWAAHKHSKPTNFSRSLAHYQSSLPAAAAATSPSNGARWGMISQKSRPSVLVCASTLLPMHSVHAACTAAAAQAPSNKITPSTVEPKLLLQYPRLFGLSFKFVNFLRIHSIRIYSCQSKTLFALLSSVSETNQTCQPTWCQPTLATIITITTTTITILINTIININNTINNTINTNNQLSSKANSLWASKIMSELWATM